MHEPTIESTWQPAASALLAPPLTHPAQVPNAVATLFASVPAGKSYAWHLFVHAGHLGIQPGCHHVPTAYFVRRVTLDGMTSGFTARTWCNLTIRIAKLLWPNLDWSHATA